jgi:hypothetical protein
MESITFYRKMANSNLILMKKYKYNQIKKLSYDDIIKIYKINNIDFDLDVIRLKKFIQGDIKKDNIIEDINLPKNITNTEESNITQTEDVKHLVITEDENLSSTIVSNDKEVIELIEVQSIIQEIITTVIEKNISDNTSLDTTEDATEDAIKDTTEDATEDAINNKNYIEEYLDKEINKNEENGINMYYALFLISILVFFLFLKK